jgi:uncharacterized protein (TIGR02466 family)
MFFLQDIPVIHNGIFIYQLNIKSKQIDYFKSVKYNPTDEGYDLSFVSEKFDILDELKELKEEINLAINDLLKNKLYMECDFNVFNSWLTKTKPNGNSSSHTHDNSWISGVYYPEENEFFKIRFHNDIANHFKTKSKKYGIYNSKSFYIQPKKDQLILFFSNLRHEVITNNSNLDRYSLAFNILPKGEFGEGDSKVIF